MYPGNLGKGACQGGQGKGGVETKNLFGKPQHSSWVVDTQFTVRSGTMLMQKGQDYGLYARSMGTCFSHVCLNVISPSARWLCSSLAL